MGIEMKNKHYSAFDMILTGLVRLFDLYEWDNSVLKFFDEVIEDAEVNTPLWHALEGIRKAYEEEEEKEQK